MIANTQRSSSRRFIFCEHEGLVVVVAIRDQVAFDEVHAVGHRK